MNTFPVAESYRRFTPPELLWPADATFIEYHGEYNTRFEHLKKLMRYAEEFGPAGSIDDLIMKSQLSQALANAFNMAYMPSDNVTSQDADIFMYALRASLALPGYEDELAEYKSNPSVRIFRVTPKTDAPVYPATSADPFPIPEFRAHGTGKTEYALLPAVQDLRKAILKKYEGLNTTEVPTETQRLHTEQGWFYGLHHMVADNDGIAPSTDSLYLRTKESFGTLGEDEFVIVYGVNHHLTGKTMYENVTVYGLTHQVTADDVDDTQLAGSATDYLPATYPDVDKLYAYKFARHCYGEEHCFEVPYGCCGSQGTPACIGEPGCAGLAADEEGFIIWRNYLDPEVKTGPDPAEVIFDHAIKFCPSDADCSTVKQP